MVGSVGLQVCMLMAVAFFTLLERKILSYMQSRKGPNKVGILGLPQPLTDAAKLLTKENLFPVNSNKISFLFAPSFALSLMLLIWITAPFIHHPVITQWAMLYLLCIMGLNVYALIMAGWSSNSKYALIGAMRGLAQTISYEVSLALLLLSPFIVWSSLTMPQSTSWLGLVAPCLVISWGVTCLAETNRAPFDFAEGESELVSGFNIEYGSGGFALLFLAEYGSILFMSGLTGVIWCSGASMVVVSLVCMFMAVVFIWARATLPRFRYDLLMALGWKGILPFSLATILLYVWLSRGSL